MTEKRARSTPPTADAADAFEELRKQVSLLHSAIEGLAAAKEKVPDYSSTLRSIEARLDSIDRHIESIDNKPAMHLTPLTLAAESHEASRSYGAEDRKSVGEAREALARSLGRVEGMIKQRRSTSEQDWWVTWAATGGMLSGALLALLGVTVWM